MNAFTKHNKIGLLQMLNLVTAIRRSDAHTDQYGLVVEYVGWASLLVVIPSRNSTMIPTQTM